MHRASVQARFALSSRRSRPPRSSSPQEVHGVKPPEKQPPALPCRLRSVALRGEQTKELWGSLGIIASDRDPLVPSGAGRHVVCVPRSTQPSTVTYQRFQSMDLFGCQTEFEAASARTDTLSAEGLVIIIRTKIEEVDTEDAAVVFLFFMPSRQAGQQKCPPETIHGLVAVVVQ
ncbi:hypothetical protein NDU88_003598 [Pleurodeles waltl]|uniref:Uncharacterized protein n=1 Tax=Pleurodeles waltl TaxID=8319 RepID=A0AAV7M4H1_PLEWA|nr:hypothetical protein NDU88_003598 [Pleurodeles waltl]